MRLLQGRTYPWSVVRQPSDSSVVTTRGSGISGGWAAKELTERGLRTLVLEAGGPIDPAIRASRLSPVEALRTN